MDDLTGGWRAGELTVVAGAAGLGTTSLLLTFLRAAAIAARRPALLVSLEWSEETLMRSILSAEARVPKVRLNSAILTDDDWHRLERERSTLAEAPAYIDDLPRLRGHELDARIERACETYPIEVVMIDAVDRLRRDRWIAREGRGWLGDSLKMTADRLGLPIIVTCRITVDEESDPDVRPRLSHLRQLDHTLEDRADLVILLNREDAYIRDSPRAGEADLFVAKNRHGALRSVTVAAQLHYARFVDMPRSDGAARG